MTHRPDSFKDFVLDQLGEGVEARAMFGGHGLYRGPAFFGILLKGRFYLRTTPATRPEFVARGMSPFKPSARQTLKSYYEVPAEVLENSDLCREWAARAWDRPSAPGKTRKPRR